MPSRSAFDAKTLQRRYYVDQDVYEQETERIFFDRWLFVGRASQIADPGAYMLFEVESESIIVLRDHEGSIHAHHNVCRHRGTRLVTESTGTFPKSIQCGYHAWTYALNGELTGAPFMDEVESFCKANYPLLPVAVAEWEGCIFVNLSDDPKPFEEAFAPLIDKFNRWDLPRLRIAHRLVYDIAANWKLVFQNYSECYHCPALHPALNRLTPFRNAWNDLEEGPFLGGPMQMEIEGGSMTMTGQRCAAPLGGLEGEDLNRVQYYTIFPNLLLSLHPDYVLTHRIDRLATDRTRIVCDWLFDIDAMAAPDFDPQPAIEFWNMTNEQDWMVSKLSQQGITSRAYTPGPYAELESMIAAWDREYLQVLEGRD
ncbi:MAG: aromatic ring-hydroxylating dioxygenase subunit alpha [Gemmatimonadota bacterium]|nr:aromatic ring-hydroxylating dioxygenase subunit alpha [Gemmatimonadota bacterium]MDE3006721.1 aromatic ring-hydroxylating dioxygenase subunit alpha [Gemmatimonadota bacterium]MDE3012734.1 aromatic ring-hydroxylating dioxygenase subunit alpha [Gemmatimonadota bacterium]